MQATATAPLVGSKAAHNCAAAAMEPPHTFQEVALHASPCGSTEVGTARRKGVVPAPPKAVALRRLLVQPTEEPPAPMVLLIDMVTDMPESSQHSHTVYRGFRPLCHLNCIRLHTHSIGIWKRRLRDLQLPPLS